VVACVFVRVCVLCLFAFGFVLWSFSCDMTNAHSRAYSHARDGLDFMTFPSYWPLYLI
jgi:hypothetical protein